MAFDRAALGKIKIIIANNTAVSSVTFPHVDTIICLGKCYSFQDLSSLGAILCLQRMFCTRH